MQQSRFIDVLLARHVSGDFAHHQELRPVLERVVFCAQICSVAVRLSRKVAVWSVCVPATPHTRSVCVPATPHTRTTQQPSWIAAQQQNKSGNTT
jgi:hypothetical protein